MMRLSGPQVLLAGIPGDAPEWRGAITGHFHWKVYPGAEVSERVAGPSSKGARRNASRHGGQMPCVVTGRTAADSGPGSGPGRTTPHQAQTRSQAGEDSALGPIAFPSKIKGSIGCP